MGATLRRAWGLLLCMGFAMVWAQGSLERQLQDQRKALKALETEVKKRREEVRNAEVQERGLLNTLSLLDQNLSRTRDYLQQLSSNEQTVAESLRRLAAELDSLDVVTQQHQKRMVQRVRELHVHGRAGEWEGLWKLLRSEAPAQRQVLYVDRLLRGDRAQVRRARELAAAVELRRRQTQERKKELERLRGAKAVEEKGLAGQIQSQEKVLNSVQTNKETQKKALAEFERNQRTMQALIRKLEERRKKEEADRKRRKLPPAAKTLPPANAAKCHPLQGPLLSSFGMQEHAVLHTFTRNLGVEIRAKSGEPVKAAAAGKVALVSRIEGRGQSIILEHGGAHYTVYGHLSGVAVKEGQQVTRCEEIARAGDDESLNGVKLYFQVNQGVQTVDPLQWLGGAK